MSWGPTCHSLLARLMCINLHYSLYFYNNLHVVMLPFGLRYPCIWDISIRLVFTNVHDYSWRDYLDLTCVLIFNNAVYFVNKCTCQLARSVYLFLFLYRPRSI